MRVTNGWITAISASAWNSTDVKLNHRTIEAILHSTGVPRSTLLARRSLLKAIMWLLAIYFGLHYIDPSIFFEIQHGKTCVLYIFSWKPPYKTCQLSGTIYNVAIDYSEIQCQTLALYF